MHNAQNTHLRTNYLKENYKWYWWNFSKVKKKERRQRQEAIEVHI